MELPRPSNSHILLTGAGFTHNFGAPLADEMWEWIFNHPSIRSTKRIQDLLRVNFDFEDAYHEVMFGDYTEEERFAIHNAVLDAYRSMDKIVLQWSFNPDSRRINIHNVNNLIALFAGDEHKCGFFFTFNQDLFVERHYPTKLGDPGPAPLTPGIHTQWGLGGLFRLRAHVLINSTNRYILPNDEEVEEKYKTDLRNTHFCYVKLHGSYDWQRHDGSPQLVIGASKEEIISKEPILRWNWELFKSVLKQGARRLLVIGYGFRDKHVNREISNAFKEHGLRLIILCPDNPRKFLGEHLMAADPEHGDIIRKAVEGYFPYTLEELFPGGQKQTTDVADRLIEAVNG